MTATSLWRELKKNLLDGNQHNKVFQSWINSIKPLILKEEKEVSLTLQIPSELHRRWIQENILTDITGRISAHFGRPCGIRLKVDVPDLPASRPLKKPQGVQNTKNVFFNSEYTFDSFIVGKSNELAYGACISVSGKERKFNPLFICGPSGLGKTHLLNAIGQKLQKQSRKLRILYLSAERFLNECVQSIQYRKMSAFQEKYRKNTDVLLMDDIQMIARGTAVQEEFFHTFNELYHKKAQVVVCSDKLPCQIPNLQERIQTRLDGGLVVDISYPDMETRLAILRDKTNKKGLALSEDSLLKIAGGGGKSVREMEGILNKIKMMEDLHGGSLSLSRIEELLESFTPRELTPEEIQKRVAGAFQVSLEDMRSKDRTKNIVTARQTAIFLIRKFLKKSLNDIGRMFGQRDHTTVINSIRKVEKLQTSDPDFKRTLRDLHREIHNLTE